MTARPHPIELLRQPLELRCGVTLKNRLAKSAMSDSLGNGEGDPTKEQIRLYERWAEGGVALSFIGEVQGDPRFPEKPGNLVLGEYSNHQMLQSLANRGAKGNAQLWVQLGHAGALAHAPISSPKGPSALNVEGLQCTEMPAAEINKLPDLYARTATRARQAGFGGVHIHAGHGFLLSQFLSPLFNHRNDEYGGSISSRCRILLEVIEVVRHAVGPSYPIGVRINSTDQIEGGLTDVEALQVVRLLDETSIDLIDVSGGTYFPGAKASSNTPGRGPYFLEFARLAKSATQIPLMVTGGFKKRDHAISALASGHVDVVGMGRALILNPELANAWLGDEGGDPVYPKFESATPGSVTAWYTMKLTELGEDREITSELDVTSAMRIYEERDAMRCRKWKKKFSQFCD
jgi:2,4-dienoyl-CoA reductase-like NADH-dependent reductase (Old Yellow Enzyme family)